MALVPVTITGFLTLSLYSSNIFLLADKALKTALIGVVVCTVTMFATCRYFDPYIPRVVAGIYFALLLIVTGATHIVMRSIYVTAKDSGENRYPSTARAMPATDSGNCPAE